MTSFSENDVTPQCGVSEHRYMIHRFPIIFRFGQNHGRGLVKKAVGAALGPPHTIKSERSTLALKLVVRVQNMGFQWSQKWTLVQAK